MIQEEKPCVICLTGQMAAGKNHICTLLENQDCVSIDLDKTVHQVIELCKDEILKAFDQRARDMNIQLLTPQGTLNRRELGRLLFSDQSLLARQESILYPKVIEVTRKFIEDNTSAGKTVIINATLLYKTPQLMELCHKIYYVTAPFWKRVIRARRRDGLSFHQIFQRFKAQKNLLQEYKKTGKEILLIKN